VVVTHGRRHLPDASRRRDERPFGRQGFPIRRSDGPSRRCSSRA
jgi:hypothetical protein